VGEQIRGGLIIVQNGSVLIQHQNAFVHVIKNFPYRDRHDLQQSVLRDGAPDEEQGDDMGERHNIDPKLEVIQGKYEIANDDHVKGDANQIDLLLKYTLLFVRKAPKSENTPCDNEIAEEEDQVVGTRVYQGVGGGDRKILHLGDEIHIKEHGSEEECENQGEIHLSVSLGIGFTKGQPGNREHHSGKVLKIQPLRDLIGKWRDIFIKTGNKPQTNDSNREKQASRKLALFHLEGHKAKRQDAEHDPGHQNKGVDLTIYPKQTGGQQKIKNHGS